MRLLSLHSVRDLTRCPLDTIPVSASSLAGQTITAKSASLSSIRLRTVGGVTAVPTAAAPAVQVVHVVEEGVVARRKERK